MAKLPALEKLRGRLPNRNIIGILVVVAIVVALYLGLVSAVEKAESTDQSAQLDANQIQAEVFSRNLTDVLEPHRAALLALAEKPTVVAALSADGATRDKLAGEEQATIADALLLRLLPRGVDHIDADSIPPLTFASVDMLHAAAKREDNVLAELHLSGLDHEHIVMIQRVPQSGTAIGFLHLSISPDLVRAAVSDLRISRGFLELRQPVAKAPPLIIARSGGKADSSLPPAIAGVSGTQWVVSYTTHATQGVLRPVLDMLPKIVAAVLLLALMAAQFARFRGGRRPAEAVDSDVTYGGAISAILDGAHPGLEQLLPGASGILDTTSPGDGAVSTIAEPAPSEFDTTTIASAGFGNAGIEVEEQVFASIDPSIFRSYDIRGIYGDSLTLEGIYEIGRALGSEASARGQQSVVVARDGRNSSQEIRDALIEGLRDSGRDVLDIGLTPSPVLYFATHYLDTHSGVMITGSHNPPEYNGLKIVLDGEALSGEAIQAIRTRIDEEDFTSGEGSMQSMEIIHDYIRRISEEIPVSLGDAMKVVVDCGNSVPGIVAPHILRAIGHDVIELYCEVDGDFPNHHPDPSQPENLKDLIHAVEEEEADLGLAFDGDGDRLGVVDGGGNIIWPDRQMMLFARDVLSRNPDAKIIYDVKCSRLLAEDIVNHGGEAIMTRTGHSLIKTKMQETGALLAGELSGHIFFKERWYGFDDALYSAARLLEILVDAQGSPEEIFAALPGGVTTPELRLELSEDRHAEVMQQLLDSAAFDDGEITTIDGLRVDFADSWGLVRASNTMPCLVLRFEGNDEAALEAVKVRFRELLLKVDATLPLPF